MSELVPPLVEEISPTEGTGTLFLLGPSSGHRSFVDAVGDAAHVFYAILWGPHWEYGMGTTIDGGGGGDSLTREIVLGSSAGGAKLSLGPGNKLVYCDDPPNYATANGATVLPDGDTSPSVKGGRLFIASNTAATTITTFDDGVPGQEIVIVATNGNTTINHGSLTRHPAAANLTLGTNDVVRYVQGRFTGDTLVWQRRSYCDN
jgi:hypothetical protein